MKKSERLNQMLRFINQKQKFSLKDLMAEFQISKRTALRDIASLEEMGTPLFADYGRYGGYQLVKPMSLPPISFTSQEIFALYFAMQALQSLASSPFRFSYQTIQEKFLETVSLEQREQIGQFQKRVAFYHNAKTHDAAYLEVLLLAAVRNQVVSIQYTSTKQSQRRIQPISIYLMKGYWYCQAYDLDKTAYRVFRCDRIEKLEILDQPPVIDLKNIHLENAHGLWEPSTQAVPFKCLITSEGVEVFQQQPFPSMRVVDEKYLVGTFEPSEMSFIISYLASYGKKLKIIEPVLLKEKLKESYLDLIENL